MTFEVRNHDTSEGSRELPLVSTIIPTYNRVDDVRVAIASALAQTYPAQEIIVVDDGSSDGTGEVLRREFGDAIRYFYKENGGVSAARNFAVDRASADSVYIAFLDSDDEWLPEKLEVQVEFMRAHPDFGMVLTDMVLMDGQRRAMQMVRRRDAIPVDGDVLRYVVRHPALAPATALVTRAAWDQVGGFDASLRTAEDLDFHLRVARHHKIGVVERALTRCMRGHDGLSSLGRTWHDHLMVIERFVEENCDVLDPADCKAALYRAHLPNARGLIWDGQYGAAFRTAARGLSFASSAGEVVDIGKLAPLLLRNLASRGRRRLFGH